MLHSRVLGEQTQLKEEMETLRRDNAQLVREHNHLKQNCEELKRLHGQDQKELADLRLQQQQVWSTRVSVCVGVGGGVAAQMFLHDLPLEIYWLWSRC